MSHTPPSPWRLEHLDLVAGQEPVLALLSSIAVKHVLKRLGATGSVDSPAMRMVSIARKHYSAT